ncbi:HPP family protein [Ghiorsea bivora]|uniref:HPP family protein n=1 Tax=Ghiorsea bivora TaxID=1485545 RepID=UPI00068F5EAE|nr:HPP family protein [Ghiorsea bivora]
MNLQSIVNFIAIEVDPTSHAEKLLSGVGGFLAIFIVYHISYFLLGDGAFLIVASMGAATVLLFAVPHGVLSQPWPLFGGHLLSAFIGVSCAQLIPDIYVAAAAAVGLSVTTMYYLRCIHPPAGATALTAVVSGSSVTALGFEYIIAPVLINVLVIFSVAFLFNFFLKGRRYPACLGKLDSRATESKVSENKLSHQGIRHALRQIDSFIDISEDDLNLIYHLANDYDQKK